MSKEKDKDIGLFMLAQLELKQYLEEIKKPSNSYYSKWESLQQFPFLLQAIQTKNLLHHDQENFDFLNEFAKFNSLDYPSISDTYNTIHINFIPKKEEETNSEAEEKTNSEAEINSFEQGFDEFQQNGKLSIENAKVNIDSSLAYKANNPEEMKAHLAKIAEAISKSIYENYFLNSHATNEINKILNSPNSLSFKISEDNGLRYALKIAKKDLRKAKYDPTGGAPIEHIVAELIKDSSKASLIFEKPPLGSRLSRNFRKELAQNPNLIRFMIKNGNDHLLKMISQKKLLETSHLDNQDKIDLKDSFNNISTDKNAVSTQHELSGHNVNKPMSHENQRTAQFNYMSKFDETYREYEIDSKILSTYLELGNTKITKAESTKIEKFMNDIVNFRELVTAQPEAVLSKTQKDDYLNSIDSLIKNIDSKINQKLETLNSFKGKFATTILKLQALTQNGAKDKLEIRDHLKNAHTYAQTRLALDSLKRDLHARPEDFIKKPEEPKQEERSSNSFRKP